MARARSKSASITPQAINCFYRFKAVIRYTQPSIWRRLLVREDAALEELHIALQAAFDWTDSHLHDFAFKNRRFMPAQYDGMDMEIDDAEDACSVRLSDLQLKPKDIIRYTYDFGDSWEHDLSLEKILTADEARPLILKSSGNTAAKSAKLPIAFCLSGARAGPLEDSGGPWGYAEICAILADPNHPEYAERMDWINGFDNTPTAFDPHRFEAPEVNRLMKQWLRR